MLWERLEIWEEELAVVQQDSVRVQAEAGQVQRRSLLVAQEGAVREGREWSERRRRGCTRLQQGDLVRNGRR